MFCLDVKTHIRAQLPVSRIPGSSRQLFLNPDQGWLQNTPVLACSPALNISSETSVWIPGRGRKVS